MKRMWSRNELRKIIQETYGIDINNLIDKDGHERFIEGDITMEEIEGITQTYGKWSLSGSHLLIVFCGEVANTTAITASLKVCDVNLPDWIKDKIELLYGASVVDIKNMYLYGSDGASQNIPIRLRKTDNVFIDTAGNLTLTADRTFRLTFDLLIDNE